ncbi:carbonic anhydrase [Aquimarina sediminis]|uniref:carbonic anhydrase n=1 Tax=Aquimarina sediminis TaxID=2070536 RepID=UPI000CA02565|nr:carbonic anhydrase family protein [Aquimarina sediminis]
MKTKYIIQILLLVVVITSCSNSKKEPLDVISKEVVDHKQKLPKALENEKHWSYKGETGPEHWAEIVKDSDCGGTFQSPINIITIDAVVDKKLKPLDIRYAKETKIHEVINNGHSIQYNFEKGDYINYNKNKYVLKQIHFHESAEHTIDGIRYPIVIHMVHVSTKGEFLVVAVMAKEGENSTPFEFLESFLPIKKGEVKQVNESFDLTENLPENKSYYTYKGSLTTPPCTEGVNWFILKNPITVSLQQVLTLRDLMPIDNYRSEQPLHGRDVKIMK